MREELKDLTTSLRGVTGTAVQLDKVAETIHRALLALADAIPYDLATMSELADGTLTVRSVGGPLAAEQMRGLRLSLNDFPVLQEALELGRPLIPDANDSGSQGLYAGLLDLPAERSSLLIPIISAGERLGLLTLDSRKTDVYRQHHIDLGAVHAQIIGLALAAAKNAERVEQLREQLEEQNRYLEDEVEGDSRPGLVLEESLNSTMQQLLTEAKQVAQTDAPVLLGGETGTGKEVLARTIHRWSARAAGPFVKVNCAALPAELIESELFGHVKGAFSGATKNRPGRFRVADRGTLLLDEIGEMPLELQPKLLRVLQEGAFQPVGSDHTASVDVRIIAATNVDLVKAIETGRFREDLYYRLSVFPLRVPALRERKEDLPFLANAILARIHRRTGRGPWILSKTALKKLTSYDWPGNVRELVNVLERARIISPGKRLRVDIRREASRRSRRKKAWPTLEEYERDYIAKVLQKTEGKVYGTGGAAEILGMKPTTLQSRLKKLGIDRHNPIPRD